MVIKSTIVMLLYLPASIRLAISMSNVKIDPIFTFIDGKLHPSNVRFNIASCMQSSLVKTDLFASLAGNCSSLW